MRHSFKPTFFLLVEFQINKQMIHILLALNRIGEASFRFKSTLIAQTSLFSIKNLWALTENRTTEAFYQIWTQLITTFSQFLLVKLSKNLKFSLKEGIQQHLQLQLLRVTRLWVSTGQRIGTCWTKMLTSRSSTPLNSDEPKLLN